MSSPKLIDAQLLDNIDNSHGIIGRNIVACREGSFCREDHGRENCGLVMADQARVAGRKIHTAAPSDVAAAITAKPT